MSKKATPARPRDTNQLAAFIGGIATEQREEPEAPETAPGARERGEARAASLSPAQRKKIAKKAAQARWKKR